MKGATLPRLEHGPNSTKQLLRSLTCGAYFRQFPNQDVSARQEIVEQAAESADLGMAGTIELYRFFLDEGHCEQFFEEI